MLAIKLGQPGERAVDVDGAVIARFAQLADQPLRLAQCIGANKNAAVGVGFARGDQLGDLVTSWRVAEDGEAEGGFCDEDVAGHHLKRGAGRVRSALVIARDDDALSAEFQRNLRRSQHMPSRMEGGGDAAA